MQIETFKSLLDANKVKWTTHCLERMQEKGITIADVRNCISNGEIIEDYPNDFPHPSCLIFGHAVDNKIIHAVVGADEGNLYVITVYVPNLIKFEADLKTRRR